MTKKVLVVGYKGNPAIALMKLLDDPVMKPKTLEAFDIPQPNRKERRRKPRA